ncbi:MAG: hypothetical protein ABSA44_09700 [Bacteroidota bacterium]|jgi:hypothetical protein
MKHKHKKQRRLNRAALFLKMRGNGWKQKEIAVRIGKSARGVGRAFQGTMPSLLPAINKIISKPFQRKAA